MFYCKVWFLNHTCHSCVHDMTYIEYRHTHTVVSDYLSNLASRQKYISDRMWWDNEVTECTSKLGSWNLVYLHVLPKWCFCTICSALHLCIVLPHFPLVLLASPSWRAPVLQIRVPYAGPNSFITGSIAASTKRQYLSYSEADFEVFRPTGVTCCADGGEIWHGGVNLHAKFHPHRCNE